jgi:hypothetical protein
MHPPPHMLCILFLIWHASSSSLDKIPSRQQQFQACILLLIWHASSSSYVMHPLPHMACILLLIGQDPIPTATKTADDEERFKVWIASHELRPRTPITATTDWRLKVWIASHVSHRCLGLRVWGLGFRVSAHLSQVFRFRV